MRWPKNVANYDNYEYKSNVRSKYTGKEPANFTHTGKKAVNKTLDNTRNFIRFDDYKKYKSNENNTLRKLEKLCAKIMPN